MSDINIGANADEEENIRIGEYATHTEDHERLYGHDHDADATEHDGISHLDPPDDAANLDPFGPIATPVRKGSFTITMSRRLIAILAVIALALAALTLGYTGLSGKIAAERTARIKAVAEANAALDAARAENAKLSSALSSRITDIRYLADCLRPFIADVVISTIFGAAVDRPDECDYDKLREIARASDYL